MGHSIKELKRRPSFSKVILEMSLPLLASFLGQQHEGVEMNGNSHIVTLWSKTVQLFPVII